MSSHWNISPLVSVTFYGYRIVPHLTISDLRFADSRRGWRPLNSMRIHVIAVMAACRKLKIS